MQWRLAGMASPVLELYQLGVNSSVSGLVGRSLRSVSLPLSRIGSSAPSFSLSCRTDEWHMSLTLVFVWLMKPI